MEFMFNPTRPSNKNKACLHYDLPSVLNIHLSQRLSTLETESRKPATERHTPLFVDPADQNRRCAGPLVGDQPSLSQHQMASGP